MDRFSHVIAQNVFVENLIIYKVYLLKINMSMDFHMSSHRATAAHDVRQLPSTAMSRV